MTEKPKCAVCGNGRLGDLIDLKIEDSCGDPQYYCFRCDYVITTLKIPAYTIKAAFEGNYNAQNRLHRYFVTRGKRGDFTYRIPYELRARLKPNKFCKEF